MLGDRAGGFSWGFCDLGVRGWVFLATNYPRSFVTDFV